MHIPTKSTASRFWINSLWTLSLARRIAPRLLFALLVLVLLQGVIPAGQALIIRQFINTISRLINTHDLSGNAINWLLLVGIALAFFQATIILGKRYATRCFSDRIELQLTLD